MDDLGEVLVAFAFPSSSGSTTYEAVIHADTSTSCSCPGWTFKRRGQERGCKHTRLLEGNVEDLLHDLKPGQQRRVRLWFVADVMNRMGAVGAFVSSENRRWTKEKGLVWSEPFSTQRLSEPEPQAPEPPKREVGRALRLDD